MLKALITVCFHLFFILLLGCTYMKLDLFMNFMVGKIMIFSRKDQIFKNLN